MPRTENLNVRISPESKGQLKEICKKTGRKMGRQIDWYIDNHEKLEGLFEATVFENAEEISQRASEIRDKVEVLREILQRD